LHHAITSEAIAVLQESYDRLVNFIAHRSVANDADAFQLTVDGVASLMGSTTSLVIDSCKYCGNNLTYTEDGMDRCTECDGPEIEQVQPAIATMN